MVYLLCPIYCKIYANVILPVPRGRAATLCGQNRSSVLFTAILAEIAPITKQSGACNLTPYIYHREKGQWKRRF